MVRWLSVACLSSLLVSLALIAPETGGSADLARQEVGASGVSRIGQYSASGQRERCRGPRGRHRAQCELARAEHVCLEHDGVLPSTKVCSAVIVSRLAADGERGRNNGTQGSVLARRFLTDQLRP